MQASGSAPRRSGRAALLAPVMLLGLGMITGATSCGGKSASRAATPDRPSTPAALRIVAPAPNSRTGTRVRVELALTGAHLAPAAQVGGVLRPDEGHIHLVLDGQLVAMPSQLTDPLPRLRPGSHTVEAEFVASDHLPFANRVVAAVTFTAT